LTKILPFRGIHYNSSKAGKMSDLVTPPYDVIGEQEQLLFYKKSPYNVIRLEYGEIRPSDDARDNRYTRAAAFFRRWLDEGILVRDDKASFYLYEQEFTADGHRLTRSGIICGVSLEDYSTGTVLPHEETLSRAKADRLDILRHCHANFSPIFALYDDSSLTVEALSSPYRQDAPVFSFEDESGESHRLWRISKKEDLDSITAAFNDKKLYIADGHHRYETALAFHQEMLAVGNSSYGFVLMTLVNLYDPGLIILPTHRLVKNLTGYSAAETLQALAKHFTVTPVELPGADRAAALSAELRDDQSGYHTFCLYTDNKLYRLSLPHTSAKQLMDSRTPVMSSAWRGLDVAVLQCLVLEDILGIDNEARKSGANLSYIRSEFQALSEVDAGASQAAFLLRATRVSEVLEVAAAGDKMPQKSTFFYPKLITGLIINDFTVE
jgi:uncharacterized protein (DUF1015 family)